MNPALEGGVLWDATTLDEIWPEKKPFGDYYWVDEDALRSGSKPSWRVEEPSTSTSLIQEGS